MTLKFYFMAKIEKINHVLWRVVCVWVSLRHIPPTWRTDCYTRQLYLIKIIGIQEEMQDRDREKESLIWSL